ncbi:MAG: DUF1513 domain-containing protein [Rhizobacter sp.]|nr:DUF1513 domain-containing protein [Rhizobacter sp.]
MKRRNWLFWSLMGVAAWPGRAMADGSPVRLAAAWRRGDRHEAGVLCRERDGLRIEACIELPSRPHAVRVDGQGRLLVVARRPGDWLLRWAPGDSSARWQWIEPDRSFNGHLLLSPDGRRLFTTETDLADGTSLVAVREAVTFEKTAEWRTGGSDAHDLVLDGEGYLLVANGGVPLQQETGRLKLQLAAMDSSITKLDALSGQVVRQWRLADRRLSLRHLAWGRPDADGRRLLGIALQAEHDDAARRAASPVLAVFDGHSLRVCEGSGALAGYGGDIAATALGFAVSCPRAGVLAHWRSDGRWDTPQYQAGVCALAAGVRPEGVWAGGVEAALSPSPQAASLRLPLPDAPPVRLDNHWALLPSIPSFNDHTENATS